MVPDFFNGLLGPDVVYLTQDTRPPLRSLKSASGSSRALSSVAYRSTRDHLLVPIIDLVSIR